MDGFLMRSEGCKMLEKNIGKKAFSFIDLFAGAGGLSEGFIQAGFNPIAHVEMNEFAAQTLVTRNAYYYLKQMNNLELYSCINIVTYNTNDKG